MQKFNIASITLLVLLCCNYSNAQNNLNQTSLNLGKGPNSVFMAPQGNAAYPASTQAMPTTSFPSRMQSPQFDLGLGNRYPSIAGEITASSPKANYIAQNTMPQPNYGYSQQPQQGMMQYPQTTYAQPQQAMPAYNQSTPYYVESSVNNNYSLVQRNSAINNSNHPYRTSPRMVSPGSYDTYNSNNSRAQKNPDIPEGVNPQLAKVLRSGKENAEFVNQSETRYKGQPNWFNRVFSLPTRQ